MIARVLKVEMMVATVWCAATGLGCGSRRAAAVEALEAKDPRQRAGAAIEIAGREDASAIPALVDRLEDEDPAVRLFTILALERLTGTRLGFRYGGTAEERRPAVERWRRFVLEGRRTVEEGPAGGTP